MTITAPGVYAMDAETYHADPCTEPSLSSTGARTLVAECPAVYWHQRQQPVRKRVFDVGTAGHLLVLEPEQFSKRVVIIRGRTRDGRETEDYTTVDARAQRDAAYDEGKVPLLPGEAEMLAMMRARLMEDPIAQHAFTGGTPERAIFWQDPEFGIWRRTRPDYLPPHGRYLVDYKTSTSANPQHFARRMLDFGYHQQAAWYLDGFAAVTGEKPERFAFVVQAKEPPFLVSVCWVDPEAIEIGRTLNRYACGLFADCLRRGDWPGYQPEPGADRAFTVNLPGFALADFERKRDAGFFNPPQMRMAA